MTRRVLSFLALSAAVACGSSFASDDGAGGSAGNGSGGGSSGGRGGTGSGGTGTGTSGDTGTGAGPFTNGGDTSIGSGGVIGAGGDGTIGSGGAFVGVGGAGNVDCEGLIADYFSEVDKSRDCDPNIESNEVDQCNPDWTFLGPCGCPVPYNSFYENIDGIDELWQQIEDNECEIVWCDAPCLTSSEPGTCASDGGERHVCQ